MGRQSTPTHPSDRKSTQDSVEDGLKANRNVRILTTL